MELTFTLNDVDISSLSDTQRRMIEDIVHLGSTVASEICTPRVDMINVDCDESVRVAMERMRGTGYSRLPVTHSDSDEIVGIVHYKDLISAALDGDSDISCSKFMYRPKYVPESKDVIKLLEEMQVEHCQMAIVIDEYGGTEGLITVEDIVEEIVGEIVDETDDEEALLERINDTTWRVDGKCPVKFAEQYGWPVKEAEDYETIAGWLLDEIDSVPTAGEEFEFDGYSFKIEKMRRNRIQSIRIEKQA